ncbi:MAG: hypothetical protein ACWGOL_02065 [Desulfuromonadales bacterium]
MIDLKLNTQEKKVLCETLSQSLSQLHDEIRHTDATEYRALLKKRQKVLLKILDLLQ